jgi:hypothetical protein
VHRLTSDLAQQVRLANSGTPLNNDVSGRKSGLQGAQRPLYIFENVLLQSINMRDVVAPDVSLRVIGPEGDQIEGAPGRIHRSPDAYHMQICDPDANGCGMIGWRQCPLILVQGKVRLPLLEHMFQDLVEFSLRHIRKQRTQVPELYPGSGLAHDSFVGVAYTFTKTGSWLRI